MSRPGQQQELHLSRERVARLLTLLQSSDEISVDLNETDPLGMVEIRELLTRVQRRYQAASLFARFPFGQPSVSQMLGPGNNIPASAAVSLAFHIGANLDVDTLAELTDSAAKETGTALYQARMTITANEDGSCAHVRALLGRYADQSMQREDTLALVNHSRACERCSAILEEFRALDNRIRDEVASAAVVAPATADQLAGLRRNPVLLWAPILLIVVFAIAALAAIGFGAASQSGASPLFAAQGKSEHRGWLILSSEQEVMAFDLESGDRRRILEQPAHDWWNPWIISPDAKLAVRWEEYSRNEHRVGALRAYDMNGDRKHLHRWFGVRARTFSGWIDNQTVLFAERGPIQRVGVESEIPDETAPSLVAADLTTGEEWVIYRGQFDKAVPAPDGRHVALVRPAPSPWPGKTVDILQIDNGAASETVASLEYRHLSWGGRIIWDDASSTIYFTAIYRDQLPERLPGEGETAPGMFDFERLHLVGLNVDGSVSEFVPSEFDRGWIVPQTFSPDGQQLAVVVNESLDRDSEWQHGLLDIRSGSLEITGQTLPGSRWWNSEALWFPHDGRFITQQVRTDRFDIDDEEVNPGTLVLKPLQGENALPTMVFQDTTSLHLRPGMGLGLLRWVPDETMRDLDETLNERPRAGDPRGVSQASSLQQLNTESTIASTGRYVLLSQRDPDAGSRQRLIHLQAWAGTESDQNGAHDFTWLPREPAVIGAISPDEELGQTSRLTFVSTDRISPLHGLKLDPASIGDDSDRAYRKPVFSPNGANLGFFVRDHDRGEAALWIEPWNEQPIRVETWDIPQDARIEPSLTISWISDEALVFSRVTSWDDGYPDEVAMKRLDLESDGQYDVTTVQTFRARGRDRGIDLMEFELSPDDTRIAIRVRHFTSRDPENDASDSILVSPTSDLSQTLEVIRSDPGEGMTWLGSNRWIVAGIDERIALLEATGRETEFISDSPAAFPVLVTQGEIWYQDLADDGRIMRVTFE